MPSVRAADQARVGQVLAGKYRIVRLVGAGGMGAVYEAQNTWTERRVALKILRPELAVDADRVRRFVQEAQNATRIAHPNIVEVLDLGREPEGLYFMIQELMDGRDLRETLAIEARLGPASALDIAVPIMGGLVAAHAEGIVHRDIKPENIVLARTQGGGLVPKLIDFGLSKLMDETLDTQTTLGAVVGTPQYMSPEQIAGERDLDGRTDVWAMGVVLYEMLTGRCPFHAASYHLLVVQIMSADPAPLASDEVPAGLADVVLRALVRDRAGRHPSMRAFLDALLALPLGIEGGLAARHRRSIPYLLGQDTRHVSLSYAETTAARLPTVAPAASPSRRWLWIAGGGAGIAVAAVVLATSGGGEPSAVAPEPAAAVAPPDARRAEPAIEPAAEPAIEPDEHPAREIAPEQRPAPPRRPGPKKSPRPRKAPARPATSATGVPIPE